jgi:non-specific serine/threonine protein kinase/serine/threonine-protein kinase
MLEVDVSEAEFHQPSGEDRYGLGSQSETRTTQGMTSASQTQAMVIGAYRLRELIGTGGMGEVWLADQQEPVHRRVAVKLIKTGMDTREVIARFQSERQALALMDHPAIARIFDAGSTPEGRPYFAMEYVPGIPITIYCDKHKLTIQERLQLFIRVCDGVQHAHQKAIIHRDLKPSNILVCEVDGQPMPKIIDFGVAKAISQRLTAQTLFTSAGTVVGTVEYMSPEQAHSGGEDIDTRTDVYSLGVVLYELLVGVLPIDYRQMAFDQMLHRLRSEDAPRPSIRLRTLGAQSSTIADNRRTEARLLKRQLHGDIDSITLKAVEKERGRRYGAPSELAADIKKYLRKEPVGASSGGFAYRSRKYFVRHRLGVLVASGFLVLLIVSAATEAVQLRRIARERDRADRITTFMLDMFKMPDPSESRGRTVTALEILDNASREIDFRLTTDPELQAQLILAMGAAHSNLGLYSRADSLFKRALEIEQRFRGPEDPKTLAALNAYAGVLMEERRYAEAEKLAREALATEIRVLGPENPETLRSMNNLAGILFRTGRHVEGQKLEREVLDRRLRVLGTAHPETLRSINDLALFSGNAEAEKLFRRALDTQRMVLGADHPETLVSMYNLARVLSEEEKYPEAEKLLREVHEAMSRVLGPGHRNTLFASNSLVRVLGEEQQYKEAERVALEMLETEQRVLPKSDSRIAVALFTLGCIEARLGKPDQALPLLRQAIDRGYVPIASSLDKVPDLESLRGNPQFTALVIYARQRDGVAGKK